MPDFTVAIPDDLDHDFRAEVYRRFGLKRGVVKRAVKEAIRLWIDTKPSEGKNGGKKS